MATVKEEYGSDFKLVIALYSMRNMYPMRAGVSRIGVQPLMVANFCKRLMPYGHYGSTLGEILPQ